MSIRSLGRMAAAPAGFPAAMNAVFEGDSITNGFGGGGFGYRYPDFAASLLPQGCSVTVDDIGTSGSAAGDNNNNYATRGGAAYVPGTYNVLCIMMGSADGAATNWIEVYTSVRAYVRKARRDGYNCILIGTIPSRSVPSGQTVTADNTYDGNTLPLNVMFRNRCYDDIGADGIMDFAADPVFATAAATTNATYYNQEATQSIHPTSAGYAVMGQIAATAIRNAVLGLSNPKVMGPMTWSPVDLVDYLSLSNGDRTIAWNRGGF